MGLTKGKGPLVAVGLCVVLAGALTGCEHKDEAKAKATTPANATLVNYVTAGQDTAPVTVSGSGTISAWQEVPIGAETGGLTAVALLVDEGQSVAKGQPLLKMNDVLLQAQVRQAKASAVQAEKAYARAKELHDKQYLSAAALDQAFANQETTAAALATAQTQLSLATVRAPVAGVISSRKAVLGQVIQPGAELFRIVRDGRIELNMEVVESELSMVKAGMPASVTTATTGTVTGTVRIVTPMVDPATRLGYARISVPWSSGLRPGMFASGQVSVGSQSVTTVPQVAIVYSENTPGVFVVGADGKAHRRKVTLGGQSGKNVIVREGLQSGDRIVTTGAGFLNDGDKVKLQAASAPARGATGA
ncbi:MULTISPECIES: efflux RND transporter periplasmic adaptor subunit [Asticcacaulis]|uniref:efflux RND transporter periplasmic adaptor subunit n=1 Tax=Asticcacaulis TaxID=76890 RepID=UPI001FD9B0AD|nr:MULTISPECIES: efflux RND transporter periplasmic adaptor subunit [Asticcacaulis]MBP2160683.1 RND family efflux transporter MFP subunit [Asticcacaulis solisilvae]MDR6801728.1 RND family efflux transporter MFP subunit [Asticcacaulis sp. BE141]